MLPSPFHNLRKALGSLVTGKGYKRPSGAPITKDLGVLCEVHVWPVPLQPFSGSKVPGAFLGKVTSAIGASRGRICVQEGTLEGHPVSTPSCCSSHRYRNPTAPTPTSERLSTKAPVELWWLPMAFHFSRALPGWIDSNHGAIRRTSFWSSKSNKGPT